MPPRLRTCQGERAKRAQTERKETLQRSGRPKGTAGTQPWVLLTLAPSVNVSLRTTPEQTPIHSATRVGSQGRTVPLAARADAAARLDAPHSHEQAAQLTSPQHRLQRGQRGSVERLGPRGNHHRGGGTTRTPRHRRDAALRHPFRFLKGHPGLFSRKEKKNVEANGGLTRPRARLI
ncbi:hypothetical protein AAFF_G00292480 [Aldrovandia affinis]|uniref:Uncharacterized protein n=1 Tax=Aldrovandia affinis TaxID=143900 RepID=A0AAD7SRQ8_9TELE|nr:hypothetical protein AAFF_G00292480 [Aldrovandia affinis]